MATMSSSSTVIYHISSIFQPKNPQKFQILLLGGRDRMGDSGKILILSSEGSNWIELALELPHETTHGGVVVLNEEIYIFGGLETQKHLYKLDKEEEDWIQLADMNEGRWYITNSCLDLNGCIWVLGGFGDLKSVEKYDPKTDKWTQMPEMANGRSNAAAAGFNGKLVISGGWNQSQLQYLTSVEIFDPNSGIWSEFISFPSPRHSHSLISYGNRLLALGGHNGASLSSVLALDPFNEPFKGEWKPLAPMKEARNSITAVIFENFVYVIGGYGMEGRHKNVEIFNGKEWQPGPELPYERQDIFSVIISIETAEILESMWNE